MTVSDYFWVGNATLFGTIVVGVMLGRLLFDKKLVARMNVHNLSRAANMMWTLLAAFVVLGLVGITFLHVALPRVMSIR